MKVKGGIIQCHIMKKNIKFDQSSSHIIAYHSKLHHIKSYFVIEIKKINQIILEKELYHKKSH